MPFIGNVPARVPLTSADITDSIITSAKIVDATIANADIANSTINLTTKVTGTLPVANGGTGLAALGTSLQVLRTNTGATALEFATPASGSFVYLGETTASNVASVSLNGYFTSDYDVYKIFIDGGYGSSQVPCSMTFNTTGSYTEQTSNYYFTFGAFVATDNTFYPYYDALYTSTTKIQFNYFSTTQAQGGVSEITIYNPLSTTYHKYVTGNSSSHTASYAGFGTFNGGWRDATAITGVNFKMNSGNIYARKIRIYGVKNS